MPRVVVGGTPCDQNYSAILDPIIDMNSKEAAFEEMREVALWLIKCDFFYLLLVQNYTTLWAMSRN